MREVKGYVFIPRFENHGEIWEPLFGLTLEKMKVGLIII